MSGTEIAQLSLNTYLFLMSKTSLKTVAELDTYRTVLGAIVCTPDFDENVKESKRKVLEAIALSSGFLVSMKSTGTIKDILASLPKEYVNGQHWEMVHLVNTFAQHILKNGGNNAKSKVIISNLQTLGAEHLDNMVRVAFFGENLELTGEQKKIADIHNGNYAALSDVDLMEYFKRVRKANEALDFNLIEALVSRDILVLENTFTNQYERVHFLANILQYHKYRCQGFSDNMINYVAGNGKDYSNALTMMSNNSAYRKRIADARKRYEFVDNLREMLKQGNLRTLYKYTQPEAIRVILEVFQSATVTMEYHYLTEKGKLADYAAETLPFKEVEHVFKDMLSTIQARVLNPGESLMTSMRVKYNHRDAGHFYNRDAQVFSIKQQEVTERLKYQYGGMTKPRKSHQNVESGTVQPNLLPVI